MRQEMVEKKKLSDDVADLIGEYVQLRGTVELVNQLEKDPRLASQPDAKMGLEEMRVLLQFCRMLGIIDRVRGCEWGRRERNDGSMLHFRYPLI